MKSALLLFTLLLVAANAWAIDTNHLPTPALQSRYENLTHDLRCVVCQDENIYNSNADIAVHLRNQVRDMLIAGQTDQQIIDYMVDRYGNFILYKPPVQPSTWVLWFGPFVLLLIALGVIAWAIRRRAAMAAS